MGNDLEEESIMKREKSNVIEFSLVAHGVKFGRWNLH